jgi:glucose/mannose transport system permease protein
MSKILRKYGTALAVISPSVSAALVCFYGCIGWMIYISFTRSKLLPNYEWAGLLQYQRLMSDDRWHTSLLNLLVFGGTLIVCTLSLGALLAIFLDQKVRIEGLLRTAYMYPLSISYVVTGLVWQWLLNPEFGFQKFMRDIGFTRFEFNWLADQDFAIFTVAIAAVWHGSGLVMAILLAGLRGIDPSIWQASRIDGIKPWRMYFHVILPMLAPVVATCVVLQALGALRAYDLVVAITGGGPGYASDLPGKFVVDYAGERANLGLAAAAAVEMLVMLALLVLPYIVFSRRKPKH